MKIIITILLALFISGHAYAEQPFPNKHMQVIEEGKIIWETEKYTKKTKYNHKYVQKTFHVLYKAEYYQCFFTHYIINYKDEQEEGYSRKPDYFGCVKQVPYAKEGSNF